MGKGLTARVFSLVHNKNGILVESDYVAKVFEKREYFIKEMENMDELLNRYNGNFLIN